VKFTGIVKFTLEQATKAQNGSGGRLLLKCDGTRAETRFHLSTKRTSPFKSAGASVQSTSGRRAAHISQQGLYYPCKPVFCSHVTLTGYPLHFIFSPSLLLPCVTVCHHISNAVYSCTLSLNSLLDRRGWSTPHPGRFQP
jgi:hypothetical protein